jgi:type I restriction enzyme S subunit
MVRLKQCLLKDEIELMYGKPLTKINRIEGNIPVYGSNGVVDYHKNAFFKGPGIIIGRKGTVGAIEYCKTDFWAIDTTYIIRMLNSEDCLKYWYYFLQTLNLDKMNSHSAVPGLNRESVYQLMVKIHEDYNYREAIAHILSILDEKIEVNTQINKTLENMAQAIFKQWFVDFKFPCIPEDYKFSNEGFDSKIEEIPNDFERVCTYKRVGNLPVPDGENWFVYVLLCKDGSFFEGITKDLYRTFYEHYKGIRAKHTKEHKPIKVLHYEKYSTQNEAIKREEELKTASGLEWIEQEYDKFKAGLNAHKSKLMMAGEMIESELGLIPKGWEVKSVFELMDTISIKHRFPNEKIVFLNTSDIYNGEVLLHEKRLVDKLPGQAKKSIQKFDILYSEIRPKNKRYAYVDFDAENYVVSTKLMVLRSKKLCSALAYYLLSRDETLTELQMMAESRSGTFPQITFDNMKYVKIALPENFSKLSKIQNLLKIILDKTSKNKLENVNLAKIRDTLLPKLMSGEIRVPLESESKV